MSSSQSPCQLTKISEAMQLITMKLKKQGAFQKDWKTPKIPAICTQHLNDKSNLLI
jgi:hypothetical protein